MHKKIMMFALMGLVLGSAPAVLRAEQVVEVSQTTVTIPKRVLVEQNMRLDDKAAAPFWSVYQEYELDMDKVLQKKEALIYSYAKNYRTLTDEKAQSLLQNYFSIEKEQLALREQYIPKFQTVLSARQVARLYQIENKIDAVIRFGLVDAIPLADVSNNSQLAEPAQS